MNYKYNASIILVNYNGKKYIDKLFSSLNNLNTPKEDYEVVFVDNNSSDDSLKYINENIDNYNFNLKIVESKENLGFAGGNNLGVNEASGKYIVLLNTDTTVDTEWLNELVKKISSDDTIGMVNSKLLFFYDYLRFDTASVDGFKIDRKIKVNDHIYKLDAKMSENIIVDDKYPYCTCLNGGIIYIPLLDGETDYNIEFKTIGNLEEFDFFELDFDSYPAKKGSNEFIVKKEDLLLLKESLIQNAGSDVNDWNDGFDIGFCQPDSDKFNHEYEIKSGCGASIMMRKEDFLKIGGFDERFFMYYEDTDLSFRMRKFGKKLIYCPSSIVRHIHTGSTTEWSEFFTYQVIRNKLLFIYKNISKESFEKEYKSTIFSAIRQRYRCFLRIRAARDAKKIINGKTNVKY